MPIFKVKDQEIHVVEEGQPGRQVAILIHGWSSSWYALSPLMGLLSQRFHCFAVDLPGYGKSPRLAQRTTIPAYVDLLASFIEQVSSGPVVLIGHSMGGMISISLAIHYPVLIERMVLIGPTISGRLSTYINLVVSPITLLERFGLGSLIVSAGERAMVGFTDRLMVPASFAERTGITMQDYWRLRQDARQTGQGRVRAECFLAMRDNDLRGKLSQIETPAVVVWGAEDNTVPLRDAGVVADEWPDADLRILPKAGHWPQFEATDTIRRLVAAYLGLPLLSDQLKRKVEDSELARVNEIAQFLAHSDVGNNLNLAQRTRLAAQCEQRVYPAKARLARAAESGSEMYVIQRGSVEVWNDPENYDTESRNLQHIASLRPGQITGELAMLDQGARSADLIAGSEGATVLVISRERFQALCQDDVMLGNQVLWNIATSMAHRVRFIIWQLHRAMKREAAN